MTERERYNAWRDCQVTGSATEKQFALIRFSDDLTVDLGDDSTGQRFETISKLRRGRRYYPSDVIRFYSPNIEANQNLETGENILQIFRLLPFSWFPEMYSMAQIFVSESTENTSTIGYLTTSKHFAKGWWKAELKRCENKLTLRVRSEAMPGSLLYWIGMPVARYLQLRARRNAIEQFVKMN
ncbi:MAG: hypothetical protein WCK82_15250 [Bacteroidota bacterium]